MTVRTVTLPINPGASWALAFPPKAPGDLLDYSVDATAWLADASTQHGSAITITSAQFTCPDTSLILGTPTISGGIVTLTIGGGMVGTVPLIVVLLHLSTGATLGLAIAMPVQTPPLAAPILIPPGGIGIASASIDATTGHLFLIRTDGVTVDAGQARPDGGGGGGQAEYVFAQGVPATAWTIAHNLGRHPIPRVVTTSGDLVDGDVHYVDSNTVTLTFAGAFAGTAYL